jgi:hypothetical protein
MLPWSFSEEVAAEKIATVREVHRSGDEVAWWRKASIDPTAAARALWLKTHPLPTKGPTSAAEAHARRSRPPRKEGPNDQRNPIEKAATSQ